MMWYEVFWSAVMGALALVTVACFTHRTRWRLTRAEFIHGDHLLTVEVTTGWPFWKRTETLRYRGSGTVWFRWPDGTRVGTFGSPLGEATLADIAQREEWAREDAESLRAMSPKAAQP